MKDWIAKYRKMVCKYDHQGEPWNLIVFDWESFPNQDEFVGDVFGDSEPGDFDGLYDGTTLDTGQFIPFALTNTADSVAGDEMTDYPQFDRLLLYESGETSSNPQIFSITVDGTAIPSVGIREFGTLDELRVPTGKLPQKVKPPSKKAVGAALEKARELAEEDPSRAKLHLEKKLKGMPPHSYKDFDTATAYGLCFVLHGVAEWSEGNRPAAVEDWRNAVEVGRSDGYIHGAVLYLLGKLLTDPKNAWDIDDHYDTSIAIDSSQGAEIVRRAGVFDTAELEDALASVEGRSDKVDAIRSWLRQ